jgi:tRNA pseudouridine38-40 synthase
MHLDEERMNRAAQYFVGEHDFAAFATADKRKGSTVRIIYNCQVARTGDELTITVTGNGFLYNMVRIISGTLIQVGLNKTEPEEIIEMLEKKDRKLSGVTAPPNGLTLYEIFY